MIKLLESRNPLHNSTLVLFRCLIYPPPQRVFNKKVCPHDTIVSKQTQCSLIHLVLLSVYVLCAEYFCFYLICQRIINDIVLLLD